MIPALPDITLAAGERLYLLLDGAQLPALERTLFELIDSPAYQPIYLYAPWDGLREASPLLVAANPVLLAWYQQQSAKAGYLLSSYLPLLPLAELLRQVIEVESPYGSRVLLKMAQPEGMARLLVDDTPLLWQGLNQVWLPVRQKILPNGPVHWWHKRVSDTLAERQDERLRLNDQQWARLGEVSWLDTLDTIAQHMRKWFPARLIQQANQAEWIAYWADWAYGRGFTSAADLLSFFNVLGFIGTEWHDGNQYPDIHALIIQHSAHTPAQRIAHAVELAETAHKKQGVAG
ncbi:DUF4123 domain-containing protein [Aeromonas cavernicola]|uniref:DUF4123 domain-containing protein n=1 Tax=Aeromonas cavernicola TaxID=1006623 RepID=A0A2H9U082_9GAMM|nr:DUF4123 domain-containing protein [Aeromonas cavernicola]PJG57421.1 hypothetical protein CUC53_18125 [Aeromonas cavernicola]